MALPLRYIAGLSAVEQSTINGHVRGRRSAPCHGQASAAPCCHERIHPSPVCLTGTHARRRVGACSFHRDSDMQHMKQTEKNRKELSHNEQLQRDSDERPAPDRRRHQGASTCAPNACRWSSIRLGLRALKRVCLVL